MSRIGRLPVAVPQGVSVSLAGSSVTVKGPRGELSREFVPDVRIRQEGGALVVERLGDEQRQRALHGLCRALLANMVTGVSQGFTRELEIEGTGYRAEQDGKTLILLVGFSHPVRIEPPAGVTFAVDGRGKRVIVSGCDREAVGQAAVHVREVRPPEPYKGKGIRYAGEQIRRKAGKAGKAR
jgi:large subunit ribosomal protein L6